MAGVDGFEGAPWQQPLAGIRHQLVSESIETLTADWAAISLGQESVASPAASAGTSHDTLCPLLAPSARRDALWSPLGVPRAAS